MTEEEVLAACAELGWSGEGNMLFGDGADQEAWSIWGGRARLMFPSPRQQRLERPPTQWEADNIGKRGKVTETVFDDSPDLPDNLAKAIAWFQARLDSVPPKLRKTATVSFATRSSYGESYSNIEITYTRPETDEEWAKRKTEFQERVTYHAEKRRQEFERMRAEFEPAPA